MNPRRSPLLVMALLFSLWGRHATAGPQLEHGFVDSDGVKIHYVEAGEGPLVVLIHGFPDFWYSWRDQIPALAKHFHVVAMDQRGFNKSGQPEAVEDYRIDKLVGDVEAVIDHFGVKRATVVGHDWGGFVAWSFAMARPQRTARLMVLNLPHPRGLVRELAKKGAQHKSSQYARNFQKPGFEAMLTPAALARWVREPEARKKYVEALGRSSMTGMLNFYRANYPREPYQVEPSLERPVLCPVLVIHGLKDRYLLSSALGDNWKWVRGEFTLVTIPEAGHFVHRERPARVTAHMLRWLKSHFR